MSELLNSETEMVYRPTPKKINFVMFPSVQALVHLWLIFFSLVRKDQRCEGMDHERDEERKRV